MTRGYPSIHLSFFCSILLQSTIHPLPSLHTHSTSIIHPFIHSPSLHTHSTSIIHPFIHLHPYIHTVHPLSIHSSTSIPTYTQYIHYPSIHPPPSLHTHSTSIIHPFIHSPSLHTCTYSKSIHPLSLPTCIHYPSIHFNRQVAASTLGDLVRKLGERILPEIFPMLEKGLKSDLTQERQGVCIGLSEIIRETSRDYMQLYANSLFPTIRLALCDKEQEVRAAAAQTFDSLYTAVGEYMYMSLQLHVHVHVILTVCTCTCNRYTYVYMYIFTCTHKQFFSNYVNICRTTCTGRNSHSIS